MLEQLYSIINARYEDERSMVITTNILDRDELVRADHERTVSRLTEMCDELRCSGRTTGCLERALDPPSTAWTASRADHAT